VLQGLRTAIYTVSDMNKAKAWYAQVLDAQPYFDEPGYVGFNVGGYELGLMLNPGGESGNRGAGGVFTCWGVANAHVVYERLLKLGAQEHAPVMNVGEGILVATVLDPFGNIFGIIENPHFKLP
jgi:predicted enzyme related to lactoylglutathione lyase